MEPRDAEVLREHRPPADGGGGAECNADEGHAALLVKGARAGQAEGGGEGPNGTQKDARVQSGGQQVL